MIRLDRPESGLHSIIMVGAINFLMILFVGSMARAEERTTEKLEVTFAPYIWASALEGDLTVRGISLSPKASSGDILTNINSVFMGVLEGRKGRWGVLIDGVYLDASVGSSRANDFASVSAVADLQMAILKFAGFYRFFSQSLSQATGGTLGHADQNLIVDLILGGRYTSLAAELTLNGTVMVGPNTFTAGQVVRETQGWVDPLIGLRSIIDVTPRVPFVVEGNIGGFGIASDFTYEAQALIGYEFPIFSIQGTVFGGYRVLYQDYSNGSGTEAFVWDMTAHGPLLGLGFGF